MRLLNDALPAPGISVIVRADCDIAVGRGMVGDLRLQSFVPVVRLLAGQGARVRIMGHRGRPGGAPDQRMSLAPVARALSRALGRRVRFVADPLDDGALRKYGGSTDILFFENLRFWPGEEKNDPAFARALARWGEAYVNEAFSVCHRAHASVDALPRLLPSCAGPHLAGEIAAMERLLHHPERPFVAVLGGAKIETKLPLIRRFARDADHVLVGGSIANTLLAKAGRNTGLSEVRRDIAIEPDLMGDGKVILPSDIVAATALRPGARRRVRTVSKMGDDEYIADIGPATRTIFGGIIASARTIVWNGPMGFAEVSAFARGTTAVAEAIARARAFSVVGGGDTMSLLSRRGMPAGFSHVSTGGGAMLAFLAGEQLPGIEALAE